MRSNGSEHNIAPICVDIGAIIYLIVKNNSMSKAIFFDLPIESQFIFCKEVLIKKSKNFDSIWSVNKCLLNDKSYSIPLSSGSADESSSDDVIKLIEKLCSDNDKSPRDIFKASFLIEVSTHFKKYMHKNIISMFNLIYSMNNLHISGEEIPNPKFFNGKL